jgi:hypothetical protein
MAAANAVDNRRADQRVAPLFVGGVRGDLSRSRGDRGFRAPRTSKSGLEVLAYASKLRPPAR